MFKTAAETLEFIFAGKAHFTVASLASDKRFTYRFVVKPANDRFPEAVFASVLTGTDNKNDYTYAGMVRNGRFVPTKGSKISQDAPSIRVLTKTLEVVMAGRMPANATIHHEGYCGKCGDLLTVTESIESNFGPKCAKVLGIKRKTRKEAQAAA